MLTRATDCGTGKHPNINVETQIPLELHRPDIALNLVTVYRHRAGAVSQKILRSRYTLKTSSSSWRNTTSAIVSQQPIVTTTSSHYQSLVMFENTHNHKIMMFVKRIFAPDICLRLRSLLRFLCETWP